MRNIAIFVSGEGQSAKRIIKLFNEGNRVKTVAVVADDSALDMLESITDPEVMKIHFPDSEWHEKSEEIARIIKDKGVKLLVLDNFGLSLSDEIMEAVDGELVRVSGPDLAPREVVAALEADLRRPVEDKPVPEVQEEADGEKSQEEEWADTLKINYRPPKIPSTPPEVPFQKPEGEIDIPSDDVVEIAGPGGEPIENPRPEPRREFPRMPSTWLIWSVLVTVFCCFIPGIVAIIFSSQVSSKYYAGDYEGARRASRAAEVWIIVSFVLGVLTATLYVPFMFIG